MIIFSRKTHGFVGETHHFRKPPMWIKSGRIIPTKIPRKKTMFIKITATFCRTCCTQKISPTQNHQPPVFSWGRSCWWLKSSDHQLRLVVYPTIYKVLNKHPRWLALGFLNHQQSHQNLGFPNKQCTGSYPQCENNHHASRPRPRPEF